MDGKVSTEGFNGERKLKKRRKSFQKIKLNANLLWRSNWSTQT